MMDLFAPPGELHNELHRDGTVNYYGPIISSAQANQFFEQLFAQVDWQRDQALINGEIIETNRKIAWYADKPYRYTYSSVTKIAKPWLPVLLALKQMAEQESGEQYNACLINFYHDGNDGMAWHSDAEKDLKVNGAIASISLGAQRKFMFKHKQTQETVSLYLQHGSLLVMKGQTQSHWLHRLPPSKSVTSPRINLTFRMIEPSGQY